MRAIATAMLLLLLMMMMMGTTLRARPPPPKRWRGYGGTHGPSATKGSAPALVPPMARARSSTRGSARHLRR